MRRRPAALLPAPAARLAGYALLAVLGALQWSRFVHGASAERALTWVLAGAVTGVLVTAARRRPAWLGAAVLGGAVLAVLASGLPLRFLAPGQLPELGDGLARGLETLNTVRLPYTGGEPWVLTTVELTGAGLCWLAAVLATWPTASAGGRTRVAALLVLVTMAASPIVSIGADRPALLGLALAVLVAAFLWLERLARRPGLGLLALGAAVLLAAVPLGSAADREEPWFDYKAFSERISGGAPVTYSWDHDYGPIDWPRDGVELFRVRSEVPRYYKADVLPTFADDRWTDADSGPVGERPADDLPLAGLRPQWMASFRVSLRRLETDDVVGAGTVLDVTDATREVEPAVQPGLWQSQGRDLGKGDSYRVRAYVPRPSAAQLAASTVGGDRRHGTYLRVQLPIRPDAIASTPALAGTGFVPGRHPDTVTLSFPPFERRAAPVAEYTQFGLTEPGRRAIARTAYRRTWRLAERFRTRAVSPYDYLLRVNAYLRSNRFTYTEVPDRPQPGVPPLESFLFDTKSGYCQQFSGAMALLLRMGGIPARVATGFSPGGQRSSDGDWVVRDTDAHSWVEAWFDDIGWVTFDPTPPATPARSQVAAIDPQRDDRSSTVTTSPATPSGRRGRAPARDLAAPVGGGDGSGGHDGAATWLWPGVALALAAIAVVLLRRRGPQSVEGAVAELERALRRTGRSTTTRTTLAELERRMGSSDYLRALRSARYRGDASTGPTAADRAAFRRQLAAGLGLSGRLRAWWALPPSLRGRRPR